MRGSKLLHNVCKTVPRRTLDQEVEDVKAAEITVYRLQTFSVAITNVLWEVIAVMRI